MLVPQAKNKPKINLNRYANFNPNFPIILNICGQVRYDGPNLEIYASYINVFSAFLYKKEFGLKYTTDNGYFFEGNIMKQKIINLRIIF